MLRQHILYTASLRDHNVLFTNKD